MCKQLQCAIQCARNCSVLYSVHSNCSVPCSVQANSTITQVAEASIKLIKREGNSTKANVELVICAAGYYQVLLHDGKCLKLSKQRDR